MKNKVKLELTRNEVCIIALAIERAKYYTKDIIEKEIKSGIEFGLNNVMEFNIAFLNQCHDMEQKITMEVKKNDKRRIPKNH